MDGVKHTDIKVGEEYAYNPSYGRASAGDFQLERVRMVDTEKVWAWKNAGMRPADPVKLEADKLSKHSPGRMKAIRQTTPGTEARVLLAKTTQIICTWDEHVVARAAQQKQSRKDHAEAVRVLADRARMQQAARELGLKVSYDHAWKRWFILGLDLQEFVTLEQDLRRHVSTTSTPAATSR